MRSPVETPFSIEEVIFSEREGKFSINHRSYPYVLYGHERKVVIIESPSRAS